MKQRLHSESDENLYFPTYRILNKGNNLAFTRKIYYHLGQSIEIYNITVVSLLLPVM